MIVGKPKRKKDKVAQKVAREEFFSRGGTPKQWIGNPSTFKDKKKYDRKQSKRVDEG